MRWLSPAQQQKFLSELNDDQLKGLLAYLYDGGQKDPRVKGARDEASKAARGRGINIEEARRAKAPKGKAPKKSSGSGKGKSGSGKSGSGSGGSKRSGSSSRGSSGRSSSRSRSSTGSSRKPSSGAGSGSGKVKPTPPPTAPAPRRGPVEQPGRDGDRLRPLR